MNYIKKLGAIIGEKFVDLMALLVAVLAVIITINQGSTQKEFERLNKQPLLNIEFIKVDDATKKGLKLSNLGFGPAIIRSFNYYLNEEDFIRKKNKYYQWLPHIEDSLQFVFTLNYLTDGFVLGEKDSYKDIFLLETTGQHYVSKENPGTFYNSNTKKFMERIVIEIEYKSMNPLDQYTYYLRYGEILVPSNYREARKQ